MFAILFWGNFCDNAMRLKPFIVVCEICIAFCFMAEMIELSGKSEDDTEVALIENNYAAMELTTTFF